MGDVRNCFPSVNPDAFELLPLPKQVIRYALDYRNLNFRHDHVKERVVSPSLYNGLGNPWPRRDGPSGMLQGSPTANLTLAWFFNDLSEHMSEGCRPFLQSDDLIVLAPSAGACSRIEEAVSRYFGGHQAGPFVLEGNIVSVHDAFEKLGYSFHKSELFGRVTVDMSGFNSRRVLRRVLAKVEDDIALGNRPPVLARQSLLNTMSGFSAVTDRSAIIEAYSEIIEYEFLAHQVRGQISA